MKIEFIRKFRDKNIGDTDDYQNRVAHRFVNKGMAKFVKEEPVKKQKRKARVKKNASRWNG